MSRMSVVCCQVEVYTSDWSLVQSAVSERDREASTMKRPGPTRGYRAVRKK